MSEPRHDHLDLIEQADAHGRQVTAARRAGLAPGAIPFEDTRPMQHWMPGQRNMSMLGAVALVCIGAAAGIGLCNVGLWIIRNWQW